MGMFDTINFDKPAARLATITCVGHGLNKAVPLAGTSWQTKDLENVLATYVVRGNRLYVQRRGMFQDMDGEIAPDATLDPAPIPRTLTLMDDVTVDLPTINGVRRRRSWGLTIEIRPDAHGRIASIVVIRVDKPYISTSTNGDVWDVQPRPLTAAERAARRAFAKTMAAHKAAETAKARRIAQATADRINGYLRQHKRVTWQAVRDAQAQATAAIQQVDQERARRRLARCGGFAGLMDQIRQGKRHPAKHHQA